MMTIMGLSFFSIAISQVRNFGTKASTKTKVPRKSRTKINWTDEQKNILSEVKSGRSMFITGSGGTGKTRLLFEIIKELKKVHGRSRVFVTAATGVAASSLWALTLHSFAGVGNEIGGEAMLARVRSNKPSLRRWKKVGALVIDEISMVNAHLFEDLEFVARKTRDVDKVWGGIQLIVSGDFFQLPPIIDKPHWSSGKEFAFEADCWDSSFDLKFQLTEVFRQKDPRLIKLLEGIRRGENGPKDLELLEQSCSETKPNSSFVQLYPRKGDVEKVNSEQMRVLARGKELVTYKAADSGKNDAWKRQLNQGSAPEKLTLREGARVMLTKNLSTFKKLVNGVTGTVICFVHPKLCPDLEDDNIADICDKSELPVVRFDSGREMVIKPELWYIKEGDSVVAQRKQVPLLLAWALSIHKCQGKTLDKLHVDLSRAFGYGMVYVVLSRVISLDGLYLSGFDPSKIMAHPKVLQFYQSFAVEQDDKVEEEEADGGCNSTKPKYPHKINWTDEQKNIIAEVKLGRSVFITGSGGTGKTLLLDQIIKELKMVHGPSKVFVTAATCVAACALRGQTLHSFAGVGNLIGLEARLSRVCSDEWSLRRWNKVEALIIDEISMVDAHLFEDLEFIARKIRQVDKVWGGIQLVVSGDFFQLPPITYKSSGKEFAFEADCWDSSFDLKFQLSKVFRQKDPRLIKLLESIRRGENDPEDLELLQEPCSDTKLDSSVVQLYPRNKDVKKVNDEIMRVLAEEKRELFTYRAADSCKNDVWKRQLNYTTAPKKLTLCEGARVMLTKNLNSFKQLVNGATGTVTGFAKPEQCPDLKDIDTGDICKKSVFPVVRFDSGQELVVKPELWYVKEGDSVVAQRKQVPLILAWAISVHKCQGATLDKLHTDLSGAFGYGMVYVALSRVRSLDGLYLSGFDPSKIMAHPKVLQFYQSFAVDQHGKAEEEEANGGCNSTNLIDSSDKSSNRGRGIFVCFLKVMR